MAASEDQPLLFADRLAAAAGASCVAALLVNPFDVIKTRMQAQAASGGASCSVHPVPQPMFEYRMQSVLRMLPHVSERVHKLIVFKQPDPRSWPASHSFHPSSLPWFHRRWAIASCPACAAPSASCAAPAAGELVYPSMVDTCRKIVQNEGVVVLWRGSLASLAMSVPMVGIYMPLYDHLLAAFHTSGAAAPMLAGTISRAVAIYCVAPLELFRTRLQASTARSTLARSLLNPSSTSTSNMSTASNAPTSGRYVDGSSSTAGSRCASGASTSGSTRFTTEGLRSAARGIPGLWRGVNATLSRDVPFSALYWGMLEPTRQQLLDGQGWRSRPNGLAHANFVAGFMCGGVAAAITTPLDVVKVRHQLSTQGHATVSGTLRQVYRQEGWRGLFRGVVPRSSRAGPACGIVVTSYEVLKDWLVTRRTL